MKYQKILAFVTALPLGTAAFMFLIFVSSAHVTMCMFSAVCYSVSLIISLKKEIGAKMASFFSAGILFYTIYAGSSMLLIEWLSNDEIPNLNYLITDGAWIYHLLINFAILTLFLIKKDRINYILYGLEFFMITSPIMMLIKALFGRELWGNAGIIIIYVVIGLILLIIHQLIVKFKRNDFEFIKSWIRKFIIISMIVYAITMLMMLLIAVIWGSDEYRHMGEDDRYNQNYQTEPYSENISELDTLDPVERAGREFSRNNCEGKGPVILSTSPMNSDDFAYLIPYGLMIGNHVTPIDHQYFVPADWNSPRDAYEVYALADGRIIDIQHRFDDGSNNASNHITDEYRLVFMHTCTFYTYFDLVTILVPEIKNEFDKEAAGSNYAAVSIDVKEGDLIGYIGGQTLDFAVWDIEKPLTGYVKPDSYRNESWKIYTANPYDYYSNDVKELLIERNVRTADPIQGKIDYDIDGMLVGNWFLEDTNGYAGAGEPYWAGHLSIVPDHIDPTKYLISIGDYNGDTIQAAIADETFDPTKVGKGSGLIKLEMRDYSYTTEDGAHWDQVSLKKNLTIEVGPQVKGCVMVEMIDDRKLKLEPFANKSCSEISDFSTETRIYER